MEGMCHKYSPTGKVQVPKGQRPYTHLGHIANPVPPHAKHQQRRKGPNQFMPLPVVTPDMYPSVKGNLTPNRRKCRGDSHHAKSFVLPRTRSCVGMMLLKPIVPQDAAFNQQPTMTSHASPQRQSPLQQQVQLRPQSCGPSSCGQHLYPNQPRLQEHHWPAHHRHTHVQRPMFSPIQNNTPPKEYQPNCRSMIPPFELASVMPPHCVEASRHPQMLPKHQAMPGNPLNSNCLKTCTCNLHVKHMQIVSPPPPRTCPCFLPPLSATEPVLPCNVYQSHMHQTSHTEPTTCPIPLPPILKNCCSKLMMAFPGRNSTPHQECSHTHSARGSHVPYNTDTGPYYNVDGKLLISPEWKPPCNY